MVPHHSASNIYVKLMGTDICLHAPINGGILVMTTITIVRPYNVILETCHG